MSLAVWLIPLGTIACFILSVVYFFKTIKKNKILGIFFLLAALVFLYGLIYMAGLLLFTLAIARGMRF